MCTGTCLGRDDCIDNSLNWDFCIATRGGYVSLVATSLRKLPGYPVLQLMSLGIKWTLYLTIVLNLWYRNVYIWCVEAGREGRWDKSVCNYWYR